MMIENETRIIVIKNNSDAVKYRLVGESGGGDMFFVTVHGKRVDVYNGGNGYRRLDQWHGAIAFQAGYGDKGVFITKNIY